MQSLPNSKLNSPLSRAQFIQKSAQGLAATALLSLIPNRSPGVENPGPVVSRGASFDLRDFTRWILEEFEPSVRLPGGAGHYSRSPGQTAMELYGVADLACVLYSLGALRPTEEQRQEWLAAFQGFQNPATGWLLEKDPTHAALHNTAFALAAMQLLNLAPKFPVKMGPDYSSSRTFLKTLNWKTAVYGESHKGAGIGSVYALVPGLGTPQWFAEYFDFCDSMFDPRNGLMGLEKPPGGDFDQIGGTFHYHFLYSTFNRQMPFPEQRIDTVLQLQQPDGYWHPTNHLWLTLDAIYLMTRTLRYCPHRFNDVQDCVRRVMQILMRDIYSPESRRKIFSEKMGAHSLTAAISIAAEAQQFLGAREVITEEPLKLVLDRRPFI